MITWMFATLAGVSISMLIRLIVANRKYNAEYDKAVLRMQAHYAAILKASRQWRDIRAVENSRRNKVSIVGKKFINNNDSSDIVKII